ncbi:phospholipid carrier-dependent glycosyltransferase [Candidatus Peregrinibacteria bacterium]|nr:phospholipid carrier-dependent glycosyltransferase [Candidatus Peregrinibacteria bacterium]
MNLVKIINFILINLSLIASSFLVFCLLCKQKKGFLHLLLSITVLFFSLITLITIGLGIFEKISFLNVSIVSYIVLGILLILTRKENFFIGQFIKYFQIHKSKSKSNLLLGTILFAPIGILLFVKFFIALFQIPLEFDAMIYHLPIVTEWLQTGSLTDIYYTAFAGPLAYYPGNFDLFYLWSILSLHNDFFVNLLNFPLLILLTVGIYKTSINFGISKKISLFASAFSLYLPVFFQQAGTAFVDIYFILTFVLAIYFLQEISKNIKSKHNSILFGLTLGLFMGTKYLGLPYGFILLIIFLFIHLIKPKKQYILIIWGVGSTLLTGAFFYFRNWVNSGNPIFPVELKLFGKTFFEGYPNANKQLSGSSLWEHMNEASAIKEFFEAFWTMTGLGGLLLLFSFFALAGLVIYSLKKRILSKKEIRISILMLIVGGLYFVLYLKAPYSYRDLIHNIRYAMPFLIIGVFSLGYLATKIKKARIIFYLVSIFAFIHNLLFLVISPAYKTRFDFWVIQEYKTQMVITTIGVVALLLVFVFKHKKIIRGTMLAVFITILVYVFNLAYHEREKLAPRFYESWYPAENQYFGIWNAALWFDKNAPNAAIAYSGFHFHYPLFGRNFQRSVDYININDCTYCRYVNYKNSSNSIRRNPDYEDWMQNLEIFRKDYIVVDTTITPEVKSNELEWIIKHPEKFELIREYKKTVIYKIK